MSDDTFVDGCGFTYDEPIGEGTRIRFQLENDRQQDISVFVKDGVLHVQGMYRPLICLGLDANYILVDTEKWEKPNG